jgi:putative phage-type endonuclease
MHMKLENKNYQIHNGIEQKSDEWLTLREGIITGSVAKQVKTNGSAYLYEVLASMTANTKQDDISHVEAIAHGNEYEAAAREAFEKKTGLKVDEVGFISNGRLGLSPDGVVFGKNTIKATVEIKCPNTKTHIKYILEGKYPKEYKDQIIHNFVVIDDLETLYFISYDPRLKQNPLYIYEVQRSSLGAEIEVAKVAYEKHLKDLDAGYKKIIL